MCHLLLVPITVISVLKGKDKENLPKQRIFLEPRGQWERQTKRKSDKATQSKTLGANWYGNDSNTSAQAVNLLADSSSPSYSNYDTHNLI